MNVRSQRVQLLLYLLRYVWTGISEALQLPHWEALFVLATVLVFLITVAVAVGLINLALPSTSETQHEIFRKL